MIIRIVEIITCSHLMLETSKSNYILTGECVLRGALFDNAVSCMVLLLPILFLGIFCTFGIIRKSIVKVFSILIGILYVVSIAISVSNIPYLIYKMANLSLADISNLNSPKETFGMMTGEPMYLAFFIAGLILIAVFFGLILRYAKKTDIIENKEFNFYWQNLAITSLAFFVCFVGARGNSKSLKEGSLIGRPLTVNFALYSEDAFLNLCAQSTSFGLIKEIPHRDRRINTGISEDEAIRYARNIQEQTIASLAELSSNKKNVVMVLMESMSAHYMSTFGNSLGLTPCIDSLFAKSHAFYNGWSDGARTNNAIFSTQTSLPGCLNLNMLETPIIIKHTTLAPLLSSVGYNTDFFISHKKAYDNIDLFFKSHSFDKIHSEDEYGFKEMHWGVRDSTLFDIVIDSLRHLAQDTKPFYTVVLTCSNHPAFSIPSPYNEMYPEMEHCAVRYADASIDTFMRMASKEPWFDNTIFVFSGDHGKILGTPDGVVATSLNHIPIFFYGKDIEPRKDSSLITQVDLEPTILGLLGLQCPNYTGFGINQMKMTKDTAIYTANNYFIARTANNAYFLEIATNTGTSFCINKDYTLSNPTTKNIPEFDKLIKTHIQALYSYWKY